VDWGTASELEWFQIDQGGQNCEPPAYKQKGSNDPAEFSF